MTPPEQPACQIHRAIILSQDGKKLLLLPEGAWLLLPSVEIPCGQRVTEYLTSAVHTRWGLDVICPFTPQLSSSDGTLDGIHYQVMQCCCHSRTRRAEIAWIPVSTLSPGSFANAADYVALCQALAEWGISGHCSASRPFAGPGWFEELQEWVKETIRPWKLHLTGRFRQFNASPSFSLIRLETDGPAVWFKGVGEPNLREFAVTLTLVQLFPAYLPQVLAARPAWNGWVAFEVEGRELAESAEIGPWIKAVRTLAELQIESIGQTAQLLNSGARDLRKPNLSSLVDPFLDSMGVLMEEQTVVSPPALSRGELVWLGKQIQDGLARLDQLRIPDALGHLDLNPGNIVVSLKECVFLDWAEACVGHPFFSFQYLLEHFRRAMKFDARLEAELIGAYAECWQQLAPVQGITQALSISPMLAAFAYAVGSDSWADRERRKSPVAARLLRSVTRRINHEALRRMEGGSRCLC